MCASTCNATSTAGNYDVGVLSPKWEEGIRVFHELVREAVGPLDEP